LQKPCIRPSGASLPSGLDKSDQRWFLPLGSFSCDGGGSFSFGGGSFICGGGLSTFIFGRVSTVVFGGVSFVFVGSLDGPKF